MSVVAKFQVSSIIEDTYGNGTTVELRPVYGGSKENEEFFSFTPVGHISMFIKNELAAKQFHINEEYYVHFEKAVRKNTE